MPTRRFGGCGDTELDGVAKTYRAGKRAVRALTDVTLSADEGEFLVIVGLVQPLE